MGVTLPRLEVGQDHASYLGLEPLIRERQGNVPKRVTFPGLDLNQGDRAEQRETDREARIRVFHSGPIAQQDRRDIAEVGVNEF
jgi:hypothetical protein